MSSFPKEYSFLESCKFVKNANNKETPIVEHYKKEIRYLEQELNYWITENGITPNETKEKKIQELLLELHNLRETYAGLTQK